MLTIQNQTAQPKNLLSKICHYAETVGEVKPLSDSVDKYGVRLLKPVTALRGGYRIKQK